MKLAHAFRDDDDHVYKVVTNDDQVFETVLEAEMAGYEVVYNNNYFDDIEITK